MSYNLYAEGDVDLVAVARIARRFVAAEVFPIADDAFGIAVPLGRANETAIAEIGILVEHCLAANARVFDLYTGEQLMSADDLEALRGRLIG